MSIFLLIFACTKSPYKPSPPAVEIWHVVHFSEILSGNRTIFPDDYGEFDDYIEIYNPQDTAVCLSGFGLTDLFGTIKYVFPEIATIQPDTVLLVWCDAEPEEGLFHANFRISSSGEWVGLLNPNLAFVDSVTVPALPTDSAFIRDSMTGSWRIDTPSPGRR